jgi:hypothetical protein
MVAMINITRETGESQQEYHPVYPRTMAYIEDVEKKASDLMRQMGLDWLENRLDPETTFKITPGEDETELTMALNYMVWRGWIENQPQLNAEAGQMFSAWKLTPEGKSLAVSSIRGRKPEPTPTPGKGRQCPY